MMLLLAVTTAALACAGLVHAEGTLAESDAGEAIFEVDDGGVTVTWAVRYEGDAEDFGWIVPIPGDFVSLADGDAERFADLRSLSQPTVEWVEDEAASCGCGGAAKGGDGANLERFDTAVPGGTNGVDVLAEGFTGTYQYVVLDANGDAGALQAWLDEHGWAGGDDPGFAHYADEGWPFVAIQVLSEPDEEPRERLLPPVAITYAGSTLAFPSVMAANATAPTQRTTVYVVGDGAASVEGWSSGVLPQLDGFLDDAPEALFEDELARRGADRGWLHTWGGEAEGRYVSRFDTLAPREVHTVDAVFVVGADTPEIRTRIVLSEDGGAVGAFLPLLAVGAWRRRRDRGRR